MNMGNMTGDTGSLAGITGIVGYLLFFFVAMLIIVLVVTFISGIVMWIQNNFHQNANTTKQMRKNPVKHTPDNDPILKVTSLITLAVIGTFILCAFLIGISQNSMFGYSSMMGFNFSYRIAVLLILSVKILMWITAISLILGVIVYVRTEYKNGNFLSSSQQTSAQSVQTVEIESDGTMTTDIEPKQSNS